MNRTVIGIQTHHSVQLDDAVRGVANASAGLRGAYKLTDFPRLLHLLDQLGALARELAAERNAARARLRRASCHRPGALPALPRRDGAVAG